MLNDCYMGCVHYETGDLNTGLSSGCTHDELYDSDANISDKNLSLAEDSVHSKLCLVKEIYGE